MFLKIILFMKQFTNKQRGKLKTINDFYLD